jgi:tetratricopeptide (TPR) repeat protein
MKQHLSVHKCAILLIFAIFFSAVTASAQYEAYLHKPYSEMIDSLDACRKRFEDAKLSIADETAEWNKIKTFAVAHRDQKLELWIDFYLADTKRFKEILHEKELIEIYQNIIDRAEKISFVEMVLTCRHTIARVYLKNKNYDASFAICKQLKQQLKQIDSKAYTEIIYAYYALVDIYYQFQEFELAVQVLKDALETPFNAHTYHQHFNARILLGICYNKLNKPDSAMFHLQSILNESRSTGIFVEERESWNIIAKKNIADMYSDNGEYEKTIPMYKEVFDYMSKYPSEYDFATGAAIGLAQSYLYTGKIKEAEILLDD